HGQLIDAVVRCSSSTALAGEGTVRWSLWAEADGGGGRTQAERFSEALFPLRLAAIAFESSSTHCRLDTSPAKAVEDEKNYGTAVPPSVCARLMARASTFPRKRGKTNYGA